MPGASLVLVDTSVWIRFFRAKDSPEASALDELLSVAAVATCAPIRAEVVSGAPTRREFQRLRALFDSLTALEPPDDLWPRLEDHRFALARRGIQASLIDLTIALTAQTRRVALWTLDGDFQRIAGAVPFTPYRPQLIAPS
jgi:hypothetical protein